MHGMAWNVWRTRREGGGGWRTLHNWVLVWAPRFESARSRQRLDKRAARDSAARGRPWHPLGLKEQLPTDSGLHLRRCLGERASLLGCFDQIAPAR
eukprot:362555-Chlamydomonas_euryale.AAC.6